MTEEDILIQNLTRDLKKTRLANEQLTDKVNALQIDHDSLQIKHNDLQAKYDILFSEYTALVSKMDYLEAQCYRLSDELSKIVSNCFASTR